jgi:hypothetical protein
MRATTKHLKSEIRGPGVALFIVEHDADNPEEERVAMHEVGWYSYDAAFFIREALQDELAAASLPLEPHDVKRLRGVMQEIKEKQAAFGQTCSFPR